MVMWTTEKPTQEGYYWIRNWEMKGRSVIEHTPMVAFVFFLNAQRFWVRFSYFDFVIKSEDLIAAEWYGPLESPQ